MTTQFNFQNYQNQLGFGFSMLRFYKAINIPNDNGQICDYCGERVSGSHSMHEEACSFATGHRLAIIGGFERDIIDHQEVPKVMNLTIELGNWLDHYPF